MKCLIAADMEGITGVVSWNHVNPDHAEYGRFRKLMTGDVNAAIEGAFRGGAEEVIVVDGHHAGYNILLEQLDSRARLNSGNTAPLTMIQGVYGSVDAAFFIGYHGHAGHTLAVLNHTWVGYVANVWLNNILVGEAGLNAAVCGHFGVPLLMVSGDQGLAAEIADLILGVETAVVKTATGYFSAECLTPTAAQECIRKAAEKAVRGFREGKGPRPFVVKAPVTVTIEFTSTARAEGAMRLPGARRLEARKVETIGTDMLEAFDVFRTLVQLGDR